MPVTLPLRSDVPHFTFTAELEGVQYGFDFRWNERAQAWFLALFDGEGDALAHGIRVRAGSPLTHLIVDARKPPGAFAVVDTSGQGRHPGLADLGTRVLIYYVPSAEL